MNTTVHRRHNSAPMCDLQFAVSLDGGLMFPQRNYYSPPPEGVSTNSSNDAQQLSTSDDNKNNSHIVHACLPVATQSPFETAAEVEKRNGTRNERRDTSPSHPRWSLLKAASGSVSKMVSTNANDVDHEGGSTANVHPSTYTDIEATSSVDLDGDDDYENDNAKKAGSSSTFGVVPSGVSDPDPWHNPMRQCLRQDAQSYLRQITKLEQQLKSERENGRQLVLAHHEALEEVNKKLLEKDEEIRLTKTQHHRVKEAYDQLIQVMPKDLPTNNGGGGKILASPTHLHPSCAAGTSFPQIDHSNNYGSLHTNDTNALQMAYERTRSHEEHYKRKLEESNRIIQELRDKLAWNGLGDTPTSTKFSYSIKEYEDIRQTLIRKEQEFDKLRENLAANAVKWGTEIRLLKGKAETATNELERSRRDVDDLRGQLDSERSLSVFQMRRTEREHFGRLVAQVMVAESDARKHLALRASVEKKAILHLMGILGEGLQ